MIRRLIISAAVVGVAVSGVSGCTDSGPESSQQNAVAWADRVCGSLREGGATLSTPPNLDPRSPAKAKASVVSYLDKLKAAVESMDAELRDAGSPPVDDGLTAYGKALDTLDEIQQAVNGAVERLRKVKVSDQEGLRTALTRAGKDLAKAQRVDGPAADLKANPALDKVFAEAPACQGIEA